MKRQNRKTTCELCGKTLDVRNAKRVPIVGHVGSTCYQRVNSVYETLNSNGLGALINGPIRVTLDDIRDGNDPLPRNARQKALDLGLILRNESEEDADGTIIAATFWLEVQAGKRLRRALSK